MNLMHKHHPLLPLVIGGAFLLVLVALGIALRSYSSYTATKAGGEDDGRRRQCAVRCGSGTTRVGRECVSTRQCPPQRPCPTCPLRCGQGTIQVGDECVAGATPSPRPSPRPSPTSCAPQGSCRRGEPCPPGTRCSYVPAYGCYPIGCPYPICLPKGTLIATPTGAVPVEQLRAGDVVWTATAEGTRVKAPLLAVARTPVPADHMMVRLTLNDGRIVAASPGHPTADGRTFGGVRTGDPLDGAQIVRHDTLPYHGPHTHDLLPAGETGFYWADGVLIGTTLSRR